jgi:hypothetical protein
MIEDYRDTSPETVRTFILTSLVFNNVLNEAGSLQYFCIYFFVLVFAL